MHPAHPLRADRSTARLLLGLLALALVASLLPTGGAVADDHEAGEGPEPVTVMTRNLYLGANLGPVLAATDLDSAIAGATEIWAQVLDTDYPERAGALADEILAAAPDLIGLQEVSLWESGPVFEETPDTVEFDFLEILLDELAARDLDYEVVTTTDAFSSSLPALTPEGATRMFSLTDRDVILATPEVNVLASESGVFDTSLQFEIAGIPIPVVRGWNWADVEVNGQQFRFINTHLEAFDENEAIRVGQAQELLDGPAGTELPVILLGDLNSNANANGEAYELVLGGFFEDAWLLTNPDDEGLTCCHAADLRNDEVVLSSRIDLVLVRNAVEVISAEVIGVDPELRTDSGLWPSDHAGVVASVVMPLAGPVDPEPSVFVDVDPNSVHAVSIEVLFEEGIVQGTSESTYGPSLPVRRDQMASFLARALELDIPEEFDLPFIDIPPANTHAGAIAAIVEAGITQGVSETMFAPSTPVTREQMATFLTRGFDLDIPEEIDLPFTDVSAGSTHEASIAALLDARITAGRTETTFAPGDQVRRDEMATFLARALGLVVLPS